MIYSDLLGFSDTTFLKTLLDFIDHTLSFIDICAALFIVCFGCASYLAVRKKATLQFSFKRIFETLGVSAAGALLCKLLTLKADKTVYDFEIASQNIFTSGKLDLNYNIVCFFIALITVCAGAFIIIGEFNYRHILQFIKYQIFAMTVKAFLIYFFKKNFESDFIYSLNFFWYVCIVLLTIIIFLVMLPENNALDREKNIVLYSSFLAGYIAVTIVLNGMLKTNFSFVTFIILILYVAFLCMVPVLVLKTVYNQNIFNSTKIKERTVVKSTESYLERNDDLMKYLHDLPKHLKIIESLASGNGEEDLADYARDLTENYYKSKNKFMSGNIGLDEILKLKTAEAKKHSTEIVFSGMFPEYVRIKSDHLTDIFSNAVDVALKSCKGLNEQCRIRVNSQLEGEDKVIVTVSAPCSKARRKREELATAFMSFNESRIRIIDRIARRYNGTSIFRIEGDTMKLIFSLKYK